MKKYLSIFVIAAISSVSFLNFTNAANEFGPVGYTFIGMYGHTYTVKQHKDGSIWLECANSASKCLENCHLVKPKKPKPVPPKPVPPKPVPPKPVPPKPVPPKPVPPKPVPPKPPVITTTTSSKSCTYDDTWGDSRSDCVMAPSWKECENTCTQTNTAKVNQKTANWTCTETFSDGKLISTTCNGSCPVSKPKPANQIITKTTIIPGCITGKSVCGDANGKIFGHDNTSWPAGIKFCAKGTIVPSGTPAFPTLGGTTNWKCVDGINSVNCSAGREINKNKTYCGDGIKQSPNDLGEYEECDDGNTNDNDSCTKKCKLTGVLATLTYCGDGIKQTPNSFGFNEQCDDGNNLSGDGCSSTCTKEPLAGTLTGGYCGDGIVQEPNSKGINEVCDDGNNIDNDACPNSCIPNTAAYPNSTEICGNGIKETPNYHNFMEECDDGNTNNNDSCSNNCTLLHTSNPGELIVSQTPACILATNSYANNVDTNTIYAKVTVVGGVEGSKSVIDLGTPASFLDLSNNKIDRVNNMGTGSLTFTPLKINWDPTQGETQTIPIATVKSTTPFVSCGNKLSFQLNGQTIILEDVGYNFKKPFIGELVSLNDNMGLGTKQEYKLTAKATTPLTVSYSISLTANNISFLGDNITLQSTELAPYSGNGERQFETRINSSSNAIALNNKPGVQVILPVISYKLSTGENVRYYLSKYDNGNDKTPIDLSGDEFLGIKVIGGIQGAGKYEFTGQGKNISNLYPADLRTEIRKKAYEYTRNMTNGQILNNVRYVEGNITISGSLSYETLVVKNGNVIISGDLNNSDKKLGIIVLKDGYNVSDGYSKEGNVYVSSSVLNINAIIYADGGLISTDTSGVIYEKDSILRTKILNKQLRMKGVLFTRNTIGGAQYVGGSYILPGGSQVQDFDKAMIYDLNYIRRGNVGCDKVLPLNGLCNEKGEYKEGFILIYDPSVQSAPPKLFNK